MNITADFSASRSVNNIKGSEELAILPAGLAKKLLTDYVDRLAGTSTDQIIAQHVRDLSNATTLQEAIEISAKWISDRELIGNVNIQNWDAYKITTVEMD